MGAPVAGPLAAAGALVGAGAAGALVGAAALVGAGGRVAAAAGAAVGALGAGLLHAVIPTTTIASTARPMTLMKAFPSPFAAGVGYAREASQRMTQVGIALDDIVDIGDYSNATMLALAARLERSTAFQELIAREIELDELWRRIETAIKAVADDPSTSEARKTLGTIFELVWQAHDLAGAEQPREAAARLRQAGTVRQ